MMIQFNSFLPCEPANSITEWQNTKPARIHIIQCNSMGIYKSAGLKTQVPMIKPAQRHKHKTKIEQTNKSKNNMVVKTNIQGIIRQKP
jgi:hypothetical protein